MKPPCKGCQDRHPNCHTASCTHGWVDYQAWVQEQRERKALDNVISGAKANSITRTAVAKAHNNSVKGYYGIGRRQQK